MAKKLARITHKIVAPSLKARGGQFSLILTHWRDIVGYDLAQKCRPLSLKWDTKENYEPQSTQHAITQHAILVIGSEAVFSPEIQHRNHEILRKVNGLLGDNFVSSIKIRAINSSGQGITPRYTDKTPKPPSPSQNQVEAWQPSETLNPRLREALQKWRAQL